MASVHEGELFLPVALVSWIEYAFIYYSEEFALFLHAELLPPLNTQEDMARTLDLS